MKSRGTRNIRTLTFVAAFCSILAACSDSQPNPSEAATAEPAEAEVVSEGARGESREPELSAPQRARAIHDAALVLDAHADIEIPEKYSRYVGADGLSRVEPAKMRAGGMDAVVMAVAVGPGPRTPEGYRVSSTAPRSR